MRTIAGCLERFWYLTLLGRQDAIIDEARRRIRVANRRIASLEASLQSTRGEVSRMQSIVAAWPE